MSSIHAELGTKSHERLLFSIRSIKYLIFWLAVWQDSMLDGSPIQLSEYTGRFHSVHPIEIILISLFVVLLIERTVIADLSIKRSYFWAPVLLMGIALFISWIRGSWINQSVSIVYEVHEAFTLPFIFFLILNLFRDENEGIILLKLVLFGTIAKAIDGTCIYFLSSDPGKSWGVLQMWRDGYLLALGISATFLLLHYQGIKFRRLRLVMLCGLPILIFTLIVSYRRTFFVAILVSVLSMFVTVGKGRRARQTWIFFLFFIGLAIAILSTDPIGFLGRLFGAFLSPGEEGSAYIRLMEYPNVLLNIWHNPIWGTAIGTQWHQYYRMPLYANFTTLGTHNTYLYWPLRAGILGLISFFWLLARMWKTVLILYRLSATEEEFFVAQIGIQVLIIYQVGCMFGILYGDAMPTIVAMFLTIFELEIRKRLGIESLRSVRLFKTLMKKQLVLRAPLLGVE